jgi:hypothetical protein
VGFGVTALISGYIVDLFSGSTINYAPAFIIILVCSVIDLAACVKLQVIKSTSLKRSFFSLLFQLPIIPVPENILKDLKQLLNHRSVITFITFAVFAGILDSLLIYFLFW